MASLPGELLRRLPRMLAKSRDLLIAIEGDRLRFQGLSISCSVPSCRIPDELRAVSTVEEVLLAHLRHGDELLVQASLIDALAVARARADAAFATAARALELLGVAPATLGQWIRAHLEARAKGDPTFALRLQHSLVVDRMGQGLLFFGDTQPSK
jgi:hypothetical protein